MFRMLITIFLLVSLTACTGVGNVEPPNPGVDDGNAPPPVSQDGSDNSVSSEDPSATMPNLYSPKDSDKGLQRTDLKVDPANVQLLVMESFPPQFNLSLKGDLPNPCHELRLLAHEPDADNKIQVEVYSVVDANTVCTEVIQPYEANLNLGSFPAGHYTVYINGEKVAEFDA